MQTLPQIDRKHLSHYAALMLLAVLPEHIRNAYLNHAKQIVTIQICHKETAVPCPYKW